MLILLLFSFFAGIVTVISPCVLPVLPPLLGAGYSESRPRSWGIIIGFIGCFTLATLTLSQALQAVGTTGGWIHLLAALLLGLFGLLMVIPALGGWFEKAIAPIAKIGQRLTPRSSTGFFGGLLLGIALGLLWTPCAGPILATIIIVTTLSPPSLTIAAMTAAYAIGAALPMLAIMYSGKRLHAVAAGHKWLSSALRTTFGLLTIAAALALGTRWTDAWQQKLLEYIPVVEIENNRLVKKRLSKLVHDSIGKSYNLRIDEINVEAGSQLPILGSAPGFPENGTWFNSKPLTMENLEGKVVLIDFWTYSCINCLRTLPHLKRWYANYKDKGLVIIGVHSPEFAFEKEPENVAAAIKRHGINYPVLLDNDYAIWKSYGNLYWPAHYLIDKEGKLRYFHFGEGKYLETENAIRQLLGMDVMSGVEERSRRRAITPEIYLGYTRAQAYPYDMEIVKDAPQEYELKDQPGADQVALEGNWIIHADRIESASDSSYIDLNFLGTRVYLVLSGASSLPVQITLDGKPITKKYYSADTNTNGDILVKEARKYDIVTLPESYGRYRLRLRIPKGISAYAFTFGDE